MRVRSWMKTLAGAAALGLWVVPPARAQFAVIDVAAIVQEVQQVQSLAQQVETARQQLTTAQDQLTQARAELQAMTGGRGMDQLLSNIARNYLPRNWGDVSAVLAGAAGTYGALASAVETQVQANSVLPATAMNALSVLERNLLTDDRRRIALSQTLSREGLSAASDRFASLQQLIDAIPGANDEKGILDLQARIGAEQNMLQNEQAKVALLWQAAQAEAAADQLRAKERALAGLGDFSTRFQPVP